MKIRVTLAGATGWVGRALIPAIAASTDLALTAAVARSAAGETVDGIQISATLAEALVAPSDVVIDYTKPNVVKAHALEALAAGRHVVIGTSGLSSGDYAEIDAAARAAGRGVR